MALSSSNDSKRPRRVSAWVWLLLTIFAYLLLFGFAYTRFNSRPAITPSAATVASETQTELIMPTLPSLPAIASDPQVEQAPAFTALPQLNAEAEAVPVESTTLESAPVTDVIAPVTDAIAPVTDVIAPVTDVIESVTDVIAPAEPRYQAAIDFPKDGDLLLTKDGWFTLEGSTQSIAADDILFVVIQTNFWNEPIIWLQQELQPDEAGKWSSLVKYGTPGYEYETYIISTKDRAAADRLRELKRFKEIPAEFTVISKKLTNAYAN